MISNTYHSECEIISGSQKHGFVSVSMSYPNSYYRVSKISGLTGSWIKCVLGCTRYILRQARRY